MGMPKRSAVFEVGFFRVSGQNKQNLSKQASLKVDKISGPQSVHLTEFAL